MIYGYGEQWIPVWVETLWPTMQDGDKLEIGLTKSDKFGNLYALDFIRKEKVK